MEVDLNRKRIALSMKSKQGKSHKKQSTPCNGAVNSRKSQTPRPTQKTKQTTNSSNNSFGGSLGELFDF